MTEKESEFQKELTILINKYSLEGQSNTPDFILAEYLFNCLKAFNKSTNNRSKFYGIHLKPKNKKLLSANYDSND